MPQFHLAASLFLDRPIHDVRAFLYDIDTLVAWDRSVSKVTRASTSPLAAGAEFATIGPFHGGREGKRSDYRVIATSDNETKVALVNSQILKSAVWTTRLTPQGDGTLVQVHMDMSTSLLYAPLGLLLKLNTRAIATDLQFLKRAIQNGEVAKR